MLELPAGVLRFPQRKATAKARPRARVALLIAIAGAAAVSAPGSSADVTPSASATPSGSDFEQVLPRFESVAARAGNKVHADEGPVTSKSPVIAAPREFDLAGISDASGDYEIRGRDTGGEWTDWTETGNGDPVWFGGMNELQVRARGWTPTGKVHYVDITEGSASPVATSKRGASGMPSVISRKRWGANKRSGGCQPREAPIYGKVKAAAIHHTVSAVDYSEAQAPGIVLGICRYHRNSNGWNDIGYNALVDRFGNIYEGRAGGLSRAVIGAHMQGYNAQTTGVAAIGTHTSIPISKATMRAMARWLAWKLPVHGHDTTGTAQMVSAGGEANRFPTGAKVKTKRIIGHRRTGYTECPGNALYRQLDKLRKKVQARIDGGGGGSGGGVGG